MRERWSSKVTLNTGDTEGRGRKGEREGARESWKEREDECFFLNREKGR